VVDAQRRADIMRWRKAERERLIAARLATPGEDRQRRSQRIGTFLEEALGHVRGLIVSAYSPFRGEPVLRDMLKSIVARGGRTALPVVVAHGKPLLFRVWAPGDPTEPGVWNIPVPSARAEMVLPDVVIAPVVGFDSACFRLGYGGGFYDRTLASFPKRPRVFGVGYAHAAIPTIHPQPHDVPMDAIVTENGLLRPTAA
jgi:5-formyltetrahydrofolate cyclo-ligase